METKKLATHAALAVAAAALVGVSAFAESRPANETRARRDAGGAIRRGDAVAAPQRARGDDSRNAAARRADAPRRSGTSVDVRGSRAPQARSNAAERRAVAPRRNDARTEVNSRGRGDSRRRTEVNRGRNDNRQRVEVNRGRNDSRSRSTYRHGRKPHYAHGRVSRVHRHGHGYRVWVHGSRYPFFIPAAHYHRDRFRVGLMIRLGGYYNDAGYYDYYDGSRAELYGIVESVDYRRNTFVVRNEATGSFVTVVARDYEADRLRAGDVVELYGDWTRSGLFHARDVDLLDSYRR